MPYKINYNDEPRTIIIDLSELGEDSTGKPYFVEIVNPNVIKYGDRKGLILKKIPKGATQKDIRDNADELYATALLKNWNLEDWETGESADINALDALEHVPPYVTEQINAKINENAKISDEDLKN